MGHQFRSASRRLSLGGGARDLIDYAWRPSPNPTIPNFTLSYQRVGVAPPCQSARARTDACGFDVRRLVRHEILDRNADDGRSRGALPAVQAGGGKRPGQLAGLSQLIGAAAPEAAGVQTSHGAIASAVSAALSGVLGTREGTLQATGTSGSTISELLQKAAQMYEHGDQKGAATLRAAAEALEGAQGPGAPGSPGVATNPAGASGAGASGAGGSDAMGQILGHVAQQAGQLGQMAQSVTQTLQGLAQGLQQIPQQVTQGIQQVSQSAGKSVDATDAGQRDLHAPQQDSRGPADDEARRRDEPEQRDEPRHRAEAAPGDSANTGRAPEPPRVEREQPAPTRPQSD